MASAHGGQDRISTKAKLAGELIVLGEVLVRARERSGLKQREVAERLGMPASYLSKMESGTRRMDVIELIRVAEAMKSDPAEIIRALQEALGSREPSACHKAG